VKRIVIAGALVFGAGQAMAQNCSTGTLLSQIQISNLLSNRYACVGSSPAATWNELHSAGQVLDYKLGPASPTDPSDTASHPTGTYAITGLTSPQTTGTVTYNYGSGGTFGYHVYGNQSGTVPFTTTGTYSFCGVSGGAPTLLVTVSPSHC
jgi:hypothetical protein